MLSTKTAAKVANAFKTNSSFRKFIFNTTNDSEEMIKKCQILRKKFPEFNLSFEELDWFIYTINSYNNPVTIDSSIPFVVVPFVVVPFVEVANSIGLKGKLSKIWNFDFKNIIIGNFVKNWKADYSLQGIANCNHFWNSKCNDCLIIDSVHDGLIGLPTISSSLVKNDEHNLFYVVAHDKYLDMHNKIPDLG